MPKLTIYLPDPLAERVKASDVSPSPVCQQALEKEVTRMEAMANATKDIEKVAERLKATQEEERDWEYREGFEDGALWARDVASARELETIAEMSGESWISYTIDEENSLSVFLFQSERFGDGSHSGDFRMEWEPYFEGLFDGAAKVWHEVADLL